MIQATLALIAKSPLPGCAKTRLCPPLSLTQAAHLAEAALRDTLAAMTLVPAARRVMVLDGREGEWLPDGVEVIRQRGNGLDERLANAFSDLPGATLIIGMDTPQVSAALLEYALRELETTGAVLGPATDGGYWAIGLRDGAPQAVLGIPMSTEGTLLAQRRRLRKLGLAVRELPAMRDVDTYEDAVAVATAARASAFARAFAAMPTAWAVS